MSVASFVAAQRTDHGVPHALSCRALGLSESWFYKWRDRPPTPREDRRAALDAAVKASFEDSDGDYGSPRVLADLRAEGWKVSKKSVEASMARQGLVARPKRRFRSLTRPDKAAPPAPDLVGRDFSAQAVNEKWCGDLTEIPTAEGKLYLGTVEDLAKPPPGGFRNRRAPRRRAGGGSPEDGRSGARRRRQGGDLPLGQGLGVHPPSCSGERVGPWG